jgi:uncharacterized protein YjbI with pentapeptide repeats
MDQLTIRQTSAELPRFDAERELELLPRLDARSRLVADFQFAGATVDALELAGAHLLHGRIRMVRAGTASVAATRMESVEFHGCDLSSLRWQDGKISRVRFDACRFLASRFQAVTMEHVVFTGCKLDYATFDQIRAAGPVMFAGCSLREAELTGCDLAGAAFDGCDLHLTRFGPGHYRRCDLRGNDLSALAGAAQLKGVIIDQAQAMQLGEALAAELKVTFGDEVPGRPAQPER